jgi:hypothetical protein
MGDLHSGSRSSITGAAYLSPAENPLPFLNSFDMFLFCIFSSI